MDARADYEEFSQAVKPALAHLRAVTNAYEGAVKRQISDAASPAMTELKDEARWASPAISQPAADAHSLAGIMTFAGIDHARTYAKVFDDPPTPVFAHLALARAALLALAQAGWLCEPGIGAKRRIQRSFGLQLIDAGSRKRYGSREIRASGTTLDRLIKDESARLGWTVMYLKDERVWTVGGEKTPTTAQAIEAALRGDRDGARTLWSYLSGVDHAQQLALFQAFVSTTESGLDGTSVTANFGTTAAGVVTYAAVILTAAAYTGRRYLSLRGWETDDWREAVRQAGEWVVGSSIVSARWAPPGR